MPSIKLSKEDLEDIIWSSEGPSDSGKHFLVEKGEWSQEGKYQNQSIVFKITGGTKCYMLSHSRSGSPFTDWNYDIQEDYHDGDCDEVEERDVIIKTWQTV